MTADDARGLHRPADDQADKPTRLRYLRESPRGGLPSTGWDERGFAETLGLALRPLPADPWDLHLVVDANPTFSAVWSDAVPVLAGTLREQRAFHRVAVTYLVPDHDPTHHNPTHHNPTDRGLTDRGLVDYLDAVRPRGGAARRMTWLLTDGMGPAWRSGRMARVLGGWAVGGPVAVLDVLAAHTWQQSDLRAARVRMLGVGADDPGRVSSWHYGQQAPPRSTGTSRAGGTDSAGAPDGVGAPAGGAGVAAGFPTVPIPVLEIDAGWIARWAHFVAARDLSWFETAAVIAGPGAPPAPDPAAPDLASSAAERLAAFCAYASPTAQRLAALLAVVPALGRRGLRAVAGIAGAHRRDLSEVFAFGLLTPGTARTTFEPDPDLRGALRAQLTRSDVERVRRAVDPTTPPPPRPPTRSPGPSPTRSPTPRPQSETESENLITMSSIAGVGRLMPEAIGSSTEIPASRRDDSGTGPPVRGTETPAPSAPEPSTPEPSTPEPSGHLPRVWANVPPRNPHFTGRHDLLVDLDVRLREGITSVLPEALHGMGGVGKTQLAAEYVYRHLGDFDVIWWIPAEQSVQIGNALIELGQRLGLDVGAEANVAVRQVVEALRLGDPYPRWLLVFDNADDPASVREYFPASPTGRILVTSRDPGWANVSRPLEVAVFRRDESIDLLRSRGGPLTDADADRLAAALGDLPLAIETAATWRAETGMSADEYLLLLESKLTDLLDTQTADYPRPVTAAWNVSLDRLAESNPAALELLQVCASFAPAPISRQLLSRAFNETISPPLDAALRDPVKLSRAIRDVHRFALARIDHRDSSIGMHRLVQAVLVNRMTPQQQGTMRHGAHVMLAASDPNDPFNPALWPVYADLYPHLVASNTERCEDPRVRQVLLNLCDYLWAWGDHEGSVEFGRRVYDAWRAGFGDEDPYTLQIGLRFGWGLVAVGRYAEAAEVNQRTYELSTRINGPDAEMTNELMGNVGADLRWRGEFAAALEIAQDAHARARRAFGSDDPQTLSTAHNVAVCLRLLGRFSESVVLGEQAWVQSVRLFGEDSSSSLSTLTGVTLDHRELGDYLGARAAQENIEAGFRRLYDISAEHPSRLHASRYLAVAHRKAGDHPRALTLSREVEQRFFNRYGGWHPSSLAAALGLSIDLRHAGLLHEARAMCLRTLRRYGEKIGETHPHTLAAAVNLAVIDRLAGRADAALDLDEQTLAAFVERLDEAHPSTLAAAANLASDLHALGRFAAALERDERTLAISTEVLGEQHPSTLAVAANLAMDLRSLGRTDEARERQASTLTRIDAVLGRDHPAARQVVAWIRLDCDIDPMPI
ncbi:FxSxx-COOH system tetratricopeptide repeat protein [Frankia sp. R82]|uniref:FxSxx-COOH system tetratricopeptide repeat protein n=1 Tax=Frankia sp. R82 TaxID=2950553 RepID=UPI0020445B23|nr:FxSxx-COOH system tetratricopeptide repeat protein [Frankia sp. R82]MCM3882875.1 FxSxx-COOH system tetratricopeptide repeat protein [Frankia sp. R82]